MQLIHSLMYAHTRALKHTHTHALAHTLAHSFTYTVFKINTIIKCVLANLCSGCPFKQGPPGEVLYIGLVSTRTRWRLMKNSTLSCVVCTNINSYCRTKQRSNRFAVQRYFILLKDFSPNVFLRIRITLFIHVTLMSREARYKNVRVSMI